jgi:hypothetical protein
MGFDCREDRINFRLLGHFEGACGSAQLSFAVESHRLPAIKRWRRVDQNCKGCQTIPLGSLKGGADEGVTDQG